MEKVTENVYTVTTKRGSNPGMVFTKEGTVFLDTSQLITTLLEMRALALERGPIRYLINLESHIDHIFGNHWFAGECPVIGHENLKKVFWKNPNYDCYDYSVDVIRRQDPEGLKYMPSREKYVINGPTITFTDKMTLQSGDHHFELYYTPGHSDANICVLVPEERVLFTADTVFAHCQTWLQVGNPFRWVQSLQFLKSLDFDIIVPGHGPVVEKRYLDVQISFIFEWVTAVALGVAKGWTLEECQERISFADRFPVDIGQEEMMPVIQKKNVKCVYDLLTATRIE